MRHESKNKVVSSRNDESQRDNFNSLTNSIPLQKKNAKYRTQKRNSEKFGEVWSHRTSENELSGKELN